MEKAERFWPVLIPGTCNVSLQRWLSVDKETVAGLLLLLLAVPAFASSAYASGSSAGSTPIYKAYPQKVTIIEFADFQDPFSKTVHPVMRQILADYGEKISFSYYNFPLSFHQYAQKAAEAYECAAGQGQGVQYRNWLYSVVQSNGTELSVDDLKTYATYMELNDTAFNSCLDGGEMKSKAESDVAYGQSLGVSGTPTFFINGKKHVGAQSYEFYKNVIDGALGIPPSTTPWPTARVTAIPTTTSYPMPPIPKDTYFTVGMQGGWNLFSVPLTRSYAWPPCRDGQPCPLAESQVSNKKIAAYPKNAIDPDFYPAPFPRVEDNGCPSETAWHYDAYSKKYEKTSIHNLQAGSSYWFKSSGECSIKFAGMPYRAGDYSVSVQGGWNMIGAPYLYDQTGMPQKIYLKNIAGNCALTFAYWYNPASNAWEKTDTLGSGQGYFVKSDSSCEMYPVEDIPPLPQ